MRALTILIAALSLAVAGVALSGCGDDDGSGGGTTRTSAANGTSTAPGGGEQVCAAVDDLQASVTAVLQLDANSSIADVESALTGVLDAGKELASAVKAGAQADVGGLQDSVQDLGDALKAVPSSDSVQAGLQQVETAADAVAEDAQSVSRGAGC
jgi:hypothetical protein